MLQNITQVANWLCPDATDRGIDPLPWVATTMPFPLEFDAGDSGQMNCNPGSGHPGDAAYCAGGHGRHTQPPCGADVRGVVGAGGGGIFTDAPWGGIDFWSHPGCHGEGLSRADLNCYQARPDWQISLARCQKSGCKGVQANKCWHGRFGFLHNDDMENPCDGVAEPEPCRVKYRTVRRWGTRTETNDLGSSVTYTFDRTATVDRYSGVIASGAATHTWESNVDGGEETIPWSSDFTSLIGIAAGGRMCQSDIDALNYGGPPPDTLPDPWGGCEQSTCSVTNTTITVTLTKWYGVDDGAHHLTVINTAHVQLSDPYYATDEDAAAAGHPELGSLKSDVLAQLGQWDLTNDNVYPWRTDPWVTVHPMVTHNEVPGPVSPDDVASDMGQEAYVDVYKGFYTGEIRGAPITGGWPLALAANTTDAFIQSPSGGNTYLLGSHFLITSVAATATRYNAAGVVQATGSLGTAATPCAATSASRSPTAGDYSYCATDGSIYLRPSEGAYTNPLVTVDGGDYMEVQYTYYEVVGGHFDQRHITTHWYVNTEGHCVPDKYFNGAWSGGSSALDATDAAMPNSATQWTPSDVACLLVPGAWIRMNAIGRGILSAQKWAEIKLPWKSQNWFGPCGKDRDLMTGQTCGVVGETCQLTEGSHLWPYAWPIEGDRLISQLEDHADLTDVPAGHVRVTLATPALYIRDATANTLHGTGTSGDVVEFTDRPTDALPTILATKEVTAVSDIGTWFEFLGTKADASAAVAVRSNVTISGIATSAPAYWWYDTDGKGEFSVITHTFDYRTQPNPDPVCSITNSCLPFSPCYPAVLCFSPNGEQFDHGITYGFGTFVPDERYGSAWQGMFRQVMADVYWREPQNPDCQNTADWDEDPDCGQCPWEEDDGGCDHGAGACSYVAGPGGGWVGARYFAHRPMVEAREQCPSPWIEDDVQPGTYDTVFTYSPHYPIGAASACGSAPGMPDEETAPWRIWLAMQACICAEGAFADDYKQAIGCYMCGSEPSPTILPTLPTVPPLDPPATGFDGETGGAAPPSDSTVPIV